MKTTALSRYPRYPSTLNSITLTDIEHPPSWQMNSRGPEATCPSFLLLSLPLDLRLTHPEAQACLMKLPCSNSPLTLMPLGAPFSLQMRKLLTSAFIFFAQKPRRPNFTIVLISWCVKRWRETRPR